MNLQEICTDLNQRAGDLETRAQGLLTEVQNLLVDAQGMKGQAETIQSLLFGAVSSPSAKAAAPKAAAPKKARGPALPSAADIRQKAEEYGVDITEVLPPKKKPSKAQKTQAMQLIVEAKRAQERSAQESPEDRSTEVAVQDDASSPEEATPKAESDDIPDSVLDALTA